MFTVEADNARSCKTVTFGFGGFSVTYVNRIVIIISIDSC